MKVLDKLRIALTGDIFRLHSDGEEIRSLQLSNVHWLNGLLADTLSALGRTEVIFPTGDLALLRDLCADERVYQTYLDDPCQAWASFFASDDSRGFQYFLDQLASFDLVVGFEMPTIMKRHLANCGTPYVSLYHHPLRFLKDQIIGLTTNAPDLTDALMGSPIELGVAQQVSRLRALFGRLGIATARVPAGHMFAIGQTSQDSSLLQAGAFTRWADYADRLPALAAKHSGFYFQEHPYGSSEGFLEAILSSNVDQPVVVNRGNSYAHIFGPGPSLDVVTLSSSMGVEAEVAGHSVHFLLADPREKFFDAASDKGQLHTLGHQVFEPDLWKLAVGGPGFIRSDATYARGADYIRFTTERWAFGVLQSSGMVEQSQKRLYPGLSQSPDPGIGALLRSLPRAGDGDTFPDPVVLHEPGIEFHCHPGWIAPGTPWTLPIGTPLCAQYLGDGFHDSEMTHVWCGAHEGSVRIPLPGAADTSHVLTLKCVVAVFSELLPDAPVLSVSSEGSALAYVLFNRLTGAEVHLDLSLCASSPYCEIEFAITSLANPQRLSISEDSRELGFCIKHLELHLQRENAEPCIDDRGARVIWAGERALSAEVERAQGG